MKRMFLLALAAATLAPAQITDTTKSPKALLHPVPVSAVTLGEGFWTPRRKVNVEVSLPTLLQLFEEKGILDNFRRLSGRKNVPRRGPLYTDSDVYKWIEAVAFVLQSGDNPALRRSAELVIDDILAAQEPSGYLNTYFSKEHLAERHTNMRHGHELYCLGHLIQAGIAWQRATADPRLLGVGRKMADYVLSNFGPLKQPIFEGHPEFELSLVELYRTTGEKRYLDFAGYLLHGDERNLKVIPPRELVYLFTGKPFTSRTQLEGHAVRALYASSGAADYYLETGDEAYRKTLDTLWDDLTQRKMYITGGVGARASGESFGESYELPNQQAYTESCAAIANLMWNWRMLQASPDGKYMDVFERALYNGANSGLSLSGSLYCYRNPLEYTGNPDDKIRNPWYDTTCCPPNLQRLLAALPGYFYSTSKEGLYVHLFHNSTLNWKLEDGTPVTVTQKTEYPWKGEVQFTVSPREPREFTLFVRIPAWSPDPAARSGYKAIRRTWKPGETVTLNFNVDTRLTSANPRIRENLGKIAVERGPLLYCMEGLDQPAQTSVFDWWLEPSPRSYATEWNAGLLGGIAEVHAKGVRSAQPLSGQPLYRKYVALRDDSLTPGPVTLIPYYTFLNREPTPMQVWIPIR